LNRQLSLPVPTMSAAMSEVIEERCGHLGVAKDARPFGEGEVGRDDDRGTLVELADEVKEQLTAGLREGQIAELVENEEVGPGELLGEPALAADSEAVLSQLAEFQEDIALLVAATSK
jgi:hypothetical protein